MKIILAAVLVILVASFIGACSDSGNATEREYYQALNDFQSAIGSGDLSEHWDYLLWSFRNLEIEAGCGEYKENGWFSQHYSSLTNTEDTDTSEEDRYKDDTGQELEFNYGTKEEYNTNCQEPAISLEIYEQSVLETAEAFRTHKIESPSALPSCKEVGEAMALQYSYKSLIDMLDGTNDFTLVYAAQDTSIIDNESVKKGIRACSTMFSSESVSDIDRLNGLKSQLLGVFCFNADGNWVWSGEMERGVEEAIKDCQALVPSV